MPELRFDAQLHQYTADGVIVPSVTQVLQSVGLVDYGFLGAQRDFYLARGKAVHLACQLADENDLDKSTLDESLAPYLVAWRRFQAETGFRPELIEHRVFNPTYRYAGTLDRTGMIGQTLAIVDTKTTEAAAWTAYQLAAYAACFDRPMRFRRFAVALHDDGTYRATEYHIKDFARDWNVFLAALTVHNAKERK